MYATSAKHRGFIALMSAIIISVVLLVGAVGGSMTGFYERSNILDAELKSRSASAADACAEQALLLLTNDPGYTGTSVLTLNSLDVCRAVVSAGSPNVRVQATSSRAVTNLDIVYNPATHTVTSWQEVAIF